MPNPFTAPISQAPATGKKRPAPDTSMLDDPPPAKRECTQPPVGSKANHNGKRLYLAEIEMAVEEHREVGDSFTARIAAKNGSVIRAEIKICHP